MLKVNTEKMAFYGKEEQNIARNICDMGSEVNQIREKLIKNLENGETSIILNNQMYKLSETLIQEGKNIMAQLSRQKSKIFIMNRYAWL